MIGEIVTGELEGVLGLVLLGILLVAAGVTPACVHPVVVVPVPILVPVVRWNLPLDADDDARFCVANGERPDGRSRRRPAVPVCLGRRGPRVGARATAGE